MSISQTLAFRLPCAALLAAGLLLVGANHGAATGSTALQIWDKVAYCESTSRWDTNTGNGYYGGLQFTPTSWAEHGGHTYADRADHATRTQQIAIARRILAIQGPQAWPKCAIYAGLTTRNGGADPTAHPVAVPVDPGPFPTFHYDQIAPLAAEHWAAAGITITPAFPGSDADQEQHRRSTTPTQTRQPAKPAPTSASTAQPDANQDLVVQPGDTLSQLARQLDWGDNWPRLYRLNTDQISDPDLIYPNQHLHTHP